MVQILNISTIADSSVSSILEEKKDNQRIVRKWDPEDLCEWIFVFHRKRDSSTE